MVRSKNIMVWSKKTIQFKPASGRIPERYVPFRKECKNNMMIGFDDIKLASSVQFKWPRDHLNWTDQAAGFLEILTGGFASRPFNSIILVKLYYISRTHIHLWNPIVLVNVNYIDGTQSYW